MKKLYLDFFELFNPVGATEGDIYWHEIYLRLAGRSPKFFPSLAYKAVENPSTDGAWLPFLHLKVNISQFAEVANAMTREPIYAGRFWQDVRVRINNYALTSAGITPINRRLRLDGLYLCNRCVPALLLGELTNA